MSSNRPVVSTSKRPTLCTPRSTTKNAKMIQLERARAVRRSLFLAMRVRALPQSCYTYSLRLRAHTSEGVRKEVHDAGVVAWLLRALISLRLVQQDVGQQVVFPILVVDCILSRKRCSLSVFKGHATPSCTQQSTPASHWIFRSFRMDQSLRAP